MNQKDDKLIEQILAKYAENSYTTSTSSKDDYYTIDTTGATPWQDVVDDFQKAMDLNQPYTSQPYTTTIGTSNEEVMNAVNELAKKVDLIFNMLRLIMTTQLEEELKQKAKEAKEDREKDQE